MDYLINPKVFSAAVTLPACVADEHLKLANGDHIKVLIYIMRNMSDDVSVEEISEQTGVSEYDVKEALLYWESTGILLPKKTETVPQEKKKSAVVRDEKPSRNDVAKRGAEDPKIRYLLQESQMKLCKNLKTNETATLVWLYDDLGLDVSVILMIIQFALANEKANIRFIEKTAVDLVDRGITSISDVDEELRRMTMLKEAWLIVSSAFGIERRKPSQKEMENCLLWVDEWKMSKDMLVCAYEACVDSKSKFSFPYVAKIIEVWHSKGYKKPEDVEKAPKKEQEGNYGSYSIDEFEKMLNNKD